METKKPTNVDTNTLVESVKNDMLNTEHGKQWIMSSYAPFKDKAAFPGFVDDSFEEIRLGYYEAQKSGAGDLYFQQMQTKHQEALLRVKRLQTPSPDIISIFVQLYNTPAAVTISSASGFFDNTRNPGSNNIFASTSNQQQTWGAPQASSNSANIFGVSNQTNPFANLNSTNIFAKPVNSIFGSSSTAPSTNMFAIPSTQAGQTSSIFGQSTSSSAPIFGASGSSAFGSQNLSNNLFGASNTGSSPLFGSSNAQTGTIFGSQSSATNSIFGAASSGPAVFGALATQSGQSPFGSTTSQPSTIFNSSNTTTSIFGRPAVFGGSSSLFGSPRTQSANNQSIFGTSTISNTPPTAVFGSPSTFGTTNAASAGIFSNTSSFLNPQSLFGSSTTPSQPQSIFGTISTNVTTSQPSFGSIAATSQPSIFASTNIAATSQPNSLFSSNNVISQPTIFGSTSISTSKPSSIFGSPGSTSQPTSIFGSALTHQTQTSGSIFNTSPFASTTQQPSIFGQPSAFGSSTTPQPAAKSIFGQTEVDNLTEGVSSSFATVANSNTGLFISTSKTPFASVTTSNTVFAPTSTSSAPINNSPFTMTSPFVNPVPVGDFAPAPKLKLTPRDYAKTNPEYYSTELTDEDIAAFQNMKFEFGTIPINPPTVDLCA